MGGGRFEDLYSTLPPVGEWATVPHCHADAWLLIVGWNFGTNRISPHKASCHILNMEPETVIQYRDCFPPLLPISLSLYLTMPSFFAPSQFLSSFSFSLDPKSSANNVSEKCVKSD